MVPTLVGRIQTRVFLLAVVGSLWTLVVTPFLPGEATVAATFRVLLTVLVLGIGWEFLYHLLQQFRWEKDWPAFFGLLTAVPEGILVWIVVHDGVDGSAFFVHFATTWLVTWLVVNGPMRVPFVRWRFRGGRLL